MGLDKISDDLKNLKTRNWHRVWEPFMRKYDCQAICELGVYKGENFTEMIAHSPQLAVAVDSWINDTIPSRNDANYTQIELDEQYEYFKTTVKDKPFVQIIRDLTTNAAKKFPNEYFDFVYIDADHSTEGCYSDITSWYPKVKPGKFLVGHDYRRGFGVVAAVDKFIKDNNLDLFRFAHSNWAVVK